MKLAILLLISIAALTVTSHRMVPSAENIEHLRLRADLAEKEISSIEQRYAHLLKRSPNYNRGRDRRAELEDKPFLGFFLGIGAGVSYNINVQTQCYNAIASSVISADVLFGLLETFWDIRLYPEMGIVLQDIVTFVALVIYDCQVAEFITTFSGFVTAQGASQLGTRVGVSFIFDIPVILEDLQYGLTEFDRG